MPPNDPMTCENDILELAVPKRLAKRVTRIRVWPDGRVTVAAAEPLEEATLKWGDREIPLTWIADRDPPRAEGRVDPAIAAEARDRCAGGAA